MHGFKTFKDAVGLQSVPKLLICPKHGPYSGWVTMIPDLGREVNSECPECSKEQHQQLLEEKNKQQRMNENRTAFNNSCIPPRFRDKSFRDYEPACPAAGRVKMILENYIRNFSKALESGTSFLFSGGTGTGKTHLACAVANNVMLLGHSAMYISSLNYLSKVKLAWKADSNQAEDDIIESFTKFDLLIFDELGKGELNAKEKAMIFRLIDRRHEENRPTIGISKFNEARICQLIDDDAVRRLKCGGGGTLLFDWGNYQDLQQSF